MTLNNFNLSDYEDLVQMLYDFTTEVYPDRKIGEKYFFYKKVGLWINDKKDIILVKRDGVNIGFSLGYYNDNGGLTEPTYYGDIAYVKPVHRKSRAAYLLYKNVSSYAKEKGLTLTANGLVTNGVSDMIEKHFNAKKMFVTYERKESK